MTSFLKLSYRSKEIRLMNCLHNCADWEREAWTAVRCLLYFNYKYYDIGQCVVVGIVDPKLNDGCIMGKYQFTTMSLRTLSNHWGNYTYSMN